MQLAIRRGIIVDPDAERDVLSIWIAQSDHKEPLRAPVPGLAAGGGKLDAGPFGWVERDSDRATSTGRGLDIGCLSIMDPQIESRRTAIRGLELSPEAHTSRHEENGRQEKGASRHHLVLSRDGENSSRGRTHAG